MRRYAARCLATIGMLLWCAPAPAEEDGPGRGVARISLIQGDISLRRGDSGDLVAAAVNAPVVVQDAILTSAASRTEIQFDYANMLRLGPNSEIRLSELEYKRYQIQLARGTTTFRVLREQDAEVEISTPNVSVRPVKRGVYRVTVRDDGTSEITVRSGEAEIFTPRGTERLRSGHTMLARGTAADPEFQIVNAAHEDDWDNWNRKRDRDLERSDSYRYVSHDIYGAEDLDNHGHWADVPPYGMVWVPRVASGWAPYRYGRWAWIDWYGWSWVSYDPWGWAPYHYGRWFYSAPAGWCWYPGGFSRHYWSPALVAFFGFGRSGVGMGFGGFGNVGWIPLAPNEPYNRWYGSRYYRNYRVGNHIDNSVNIVNNVSITNLYRNARVLNGVTAVDGESFGRGRLGNTIHVSDGDFKQAGLVRGQLPVTPVRESLKLADRESVIPRTVNTEPARFFSRRQATAVERIPFEEQRRGIEQATRRSFRDTTVRTGAAEVPAVPAVRSSSSGERSAEQGTRPDTRSHPTRSVDSGSEWRRFGAARTAEPGRSETPMRRLESMPTMDRTVRDSTRSEDSGWRRFGDPGAVRPGGTRRIPEHTTGGSGTAEGWRRSAETGIRGDAASRTMDRSEGWRRENRSEPRTEAPPQRLNFGNEHRRFEPRNGTPSGAEVRISPPIVRERAAERFNAPRMDGTRGESRSNGTGVPRSAEGSSRSSDGGGRGEGRSGRGR